MTIAIRNSDNCFSGTVSTHSCQYATGISPPTPQQGIQTPVAQRSAVTPHTLTNHWGLYEAPGVGLRDVGLQDPRGSAGLVDPSEDVDLAPAHGGRGRVHGLGQGGDGLPLVGDGVVPGDDSRSSELSSAAVGSTDRHRKVAWQGKQRWKCIFFNILQIQPLGKCCNECFSQRF